MEAPSGDGDEAALPLDFAQPNAAAANRAHASMMNRRELILSGFVPVKCGAWANASKTLDGTYIR